MDFTITETNRGNKSLICEDYNFRFHKSLKNGNNSWRCSNKKCKATCKTDSENLVLVEMNGTHNHDADKQKVERQQIRVAVKRRANDDVTCRPSKLIRSELQQSAESSLQSKDLQRLQLAIYRERRKEYPTLPKSRAEVKHYL